MKIFRRKKQKNKFRFNSLSNYSKILDYIKEFDTLNQELGGRYYIEIERSNKGLDINISSRNKVAPKRAKKALKIENEKDTAD